MLSPNRRQQLERGLALVRRATLLDTVREVPHAHRRGWEALREGADSR